MRYACLFFIAILAFGLFGCDQAADPIVGTDAMSYVNVNGGDNCHTLWAGQNIDAGTVCYDDIDTDDDGIPDALQVCYSVNECWEINEIHFAIGNSLTNIPTNKGGNPKVGKFPYSFSFEAGVTNHCLVIPFTDIGFTCDNTGALYVAAHAALSNSCTGQTETGWGEGLGFDGGSWAMYATIEIHCDDQPPGPGCETGFAYDCNGLEQCFRDLDLDGDGVRDFSRWGWTNGPYGEGFYTLQLFTGAGQCDIAKGTLVGLVTVAYLGDEVTVTYTTCGSYEMDEVHIYVGNEILPRNTDPMDPENGEFTVAPGQYPVVLDLPSGTNTVSHTFTGVTGEIYVVAHAVVCGDFNAGDCGSRDCVEPCIPGFDYAGFSAQIEAANDDPGQMKIKVQYPYGGGPAYFPQTWIDYDGDGTEEMLTQSWCVDLDNVIYQNTWYCAVLYSSYDDLTGLVERWENMDMVNWILNQNFVGQPSPSGGVYSYAHVQRAIWELIEDGIPNPSGWIAQTAQSNEIRDAAIAAVPLDDPTVNYEPPCDGVVGVILAPVTCPGGTVAQILIAQVLVAEYPGICSDCF